ncbi:hypothetical protein Tel_13330 [Candidatus Tenderia electrophaga]|uniref:Uncharacterized protein n=1 Tax=Candidatus Tenderia electrophaga TaxID=1748243 RepID=A0A0S2TFT5_9GAMM|nr:hypothetical protein Tel_13330 [Candidatus Tenderia electrophaga]
MAKRDPVLDSKRKKAHALLQQNRIAEARKLFGDICRRQRLDYEAWINYGALSGRLGQYSEAQAAFQRALQLRPDAAAIHFNLAGLAELQQDPAAAEQFYLSYLKLKPAATDGHKRLARLYLTLGRWEDAERYCRQALDMDPVDAAALNCLANVKQEQGAFDAAEMIYREALHHGANEAEIYANLGNLFHAKGDFEAALAWYEKSLSLAPRSAATLASLAYLHFRYAHFDEARACFDRALQIDPDSHAMRWNRALLLLLIGEFKQGWLDYESRFKTLETMRQFGRRYSSRPRWDGRPIPAKTLLVYAEQGMGDTIQFCRYLNLIEDRVGTLVLECPASLADLMRSLSGVDRVITPQDHGDYDYQIPLLSLPGLLDTEFDSIPAEVPYLTVDEARLSKWENLISGSGLRVGLVWAGNPRGINDKRRSLALQQLAPLARVPKVTFYSLQKGDAADQLRDAPAGMNIIDLGPQLNDFSDTAAAICHLDLVISVCTAVAHLSGALGRPAWTLLSHPADWRWFLERKDSPWYPTMRLFRQPEVGEWESVIEEVVAALAEQSAEG